MKRLARLLCSLAVVAASSGMLTSAFAASDAFFSGSYADMCMKSANMPAPFGEYDLKGNAKLPQYCACFSALFTARAQAAAAGTQPRGSVEEHVAGERAMRSTCRAQFHLPPVKVPPGGAGGKAG